MHPKSSRMARQAPFPTLVFNLHWQFEKLRELGTYKRVRNAIRKRDKSLGQNASIDSTKNNTSNAFNYKSLIIPSVLIGYGVIGQESLTLKDIDYRTKNEFNYFLAFRLAGGLGIPFGPQNVLPVIFNIKKSNYFFVFPGAMGRICRKINE